MAFTVSCYPVAFPNIAAKTVRVFEILSFKYAFLVGLDSKEAVRSQCLTLGVFWPSAACPLGVGSTQGAISQPDCHRHVEIYLGFYFSNGHNKATKAADVVFLSFT